MFYRWWCIARKTLKKQHWIAEKGFDTAKIETPGPLEKSSSFTPRRCYITKNRYIGCKSYMKTKVTSALHRTSTAPGFLVLIRAKLRSVLQRSCNPRLGSWTSVLSWRGDRFQIPIWHNDRSKVFCRSMFRPFILCLMIRSAVMMSSSR